jgi:hypothetical protein
VPNTLGHLGVQGFVTRALIRDADIKWICAGAVIPDLPWIVQRAVIPWIPSERILDVRLYFMVQGSLAFCLLLSAGIAWLSREPGAVFKILGLNVVLHLLLDATQVRWAEGVFLFAPFSWSVARFGLFWPESAFAVVITAAGLVFCAYGWRVRPGRPVVFRPRSAQAASVGAILLLAYGLLPPLFVAEAERSGNGFYSALRPDADRAGRAIGFDRVPATERGAVSEARAVTGERFELRAPTEVGHGRVSLQGEFMDAKTIRVTRLHRHWPGFRDGASYLGLLIVGLIWVADGWRRRRSPRARTAGPTR